MGGMGSGGRRVGAGRKPKDEVARSLDGGASHRPGRVLAHPSAATSPPDPVPVDESEAPNDLTMEERQIWLELAPFALASGTLTPATSLAFRRLCRHVVLERRYALSVMDAGGANHRGLIQRVDTELLSFSLSPSGRRIATEKPAVDPMEAKYFGDSRNSA